ncbi:Cu2+-exporting ATPase [Eubacterium maltosivorans]|uniref:copper-translocating P-type ATPase n=1 Tax=Eubacterium maltosivorans TaxID=2041044 RepID=UPI00087EDC2D|nr:copper-translocating P-type ATPase [Eubacterium maltosivorans]WPK82391.1 Copper-exporting P-type ATPase B [Eubacterium maltosivorans]SDO49444.1 Cu2+-exporting ATPase [Eubacterium maltosivorans]
MNDTHHKMEHNHSMEAMGEMDHSSMQMSGMDHHAMMVQDFKRRFWVSLAVMIPILVLSPMIQMFLGVDWRFPGDSYILLVLSTFLFFYGGWPFLKGAKDELRHKSPAMMTLIALAIIVAYVYSAATVFGVQGSDFFWELASLIVIMLLGHWIEMRSVMGASKALEELAKLMPESAHMIMDNGETMEMPVSSLKAGQAVLVKPGEKIPIDGVVYEGDSEVNEAMITGEAIPVEKGKEDEVIGGSVNGDGILKFKVSHVGDDTFLSQVIRLVRDAQASKSNTQRLADRAAKWLFYIALTTGIITFITWMAIEGNLNFAVTRAVTVIIICCPHALGLAMPLVTSVSTSLAAKNGLLFRNRAAFENARNLDTVVFDKTGTLTEGSFGVTDIKADSVSEDDLLAIAASVEENSEHPIARGIVEAGKSRELAMLRVTDYQNLTGEGLRASVDGRPVKIVSPGYLKREGIAFDEKSYSSLAEEGKTVVFILRDNKLLGFIALSDVARPTAKEAVDELKQMEVASIMLTGDNQRAADYVARQLDINQVFAEVLPGDKASKIDELRRDGRRVAMTGDGVNDAPSLAKADLGIAIGAGTSVAIETADVILVKSDPLDVVGILKLSRATFKKMVQNLIWATAYNVVALPLAAGVLYYQGVVISPAAGAVLMSLSTIIVAINARLLKLPKK